MSDPIRPIGLEIITCSLQTDDGRIEKFIGGGISLRSGGFSLNFSDVRSAELAIANFGRLLKTLKMVGESLRA